MYASVMIDLKTNQIESTYDYIIPTDLCGFLKVGMRVVVPFGNLTRAAVIVELKDKSLEATKYIEYALDIDPTVTKNQIFLMDYLEKQTFISKAMAFSLFVPKALQMKYKKKIIVLNRSKLGTLSSLITKDEMIMNEGLSKHLTKLKKAHDQGYIVIEDDIKTRGSIKYERHYTVNNHNEKLTKKRLEIIELIEDGVNSQTALVERGVSKPILDVMLKIGILSATLNENQSKSTLFFKKPLKDKTLTHEQQQAVKSINAKITQYERFLLNGVTASGKTEVFIEMRKALAEDRQMLLLVPEITQVYQLAATFSNSFDDVYMIHANLSDQERYDTWRQIKNGSAKVIIGTRSSIFLPFKDLGAIVIDEAHDSAYIQSVIPRYDAIELAQVLAQKSSAPFVLSTATPTVEQYYDAQMGKMTLLNLEKSIFKKEQISIVVDMKKELILGNKDMFSNALKDAITNLNKGEQAMILVNRRGYAPFVLCRECGFVPTCDICHTSMVYHKKYNRLVCHHCGIKKPWSNTCQSCGSNKVKTVGIGIEQVEESLIKLFPSKIIKRLDSDNTKKGEVESILQSFNEKKIDILVGTQIIAKGHDFDVKVSAVLLADMGLKLPSFKANEYTHHLIKQMKGRSGRFGKGMNIIQAYDVNHFVIKNIDEPYQTFYDIEIKNRLLSYNPPFSKLVYISFSNKSEDLIIETLIRVKNEIIKKHSQYVVLGPTESFIPFKNGQFHYHLLLKVAKRIDLSFLLNGILKKYEKTFNIDINLFDDFI